jgi:mxaJ protein
MFSLCRNTALAITILTPWLPGQTRILRVCADPANLPFSNQQEQGIENKLAGILASSIGARLEYTWWSQRRFFLRNSLNAGECDAVMGVPAALETVAVTRPYYQSHYMLVTRPGVKLRSLDDPALAKMRIGLHIAGEDYTPPAHLLAMRGLAGNLVGYPLYGQPGHILDAVRSGEIGAAIVWGPVAGYFGRGLEISDVEPAGPLTTFDIAVAVRKQDIALRDELNAALERECAAVEALLARFSVPREGGLCGVRSQPQSASSR